MNEIQIPRELRQQLDEMLEVPANAETIHFWERDRSEEIYLPVEDGEIRVYHNKPASPSACRPIVFIPGWGALADSFNDFYSIIYPHAEFYHIETREKHSSRLNRKKARMDMSQKAHDIRDVIRQLGLGAQNDFLLFGTCWGSAIILHGLIERIIQAPTLVAFDPMHSLWFPKWLLNWVIPLTSISMAHLIRPLGKRLALSGMKEKVQRHRTGRFIDNAVLWKWKRAALHTKNFELFGKLCGIRDEVFVVNGTKDKIHDNANYPKIAHEIPRGRYIYMETHESKRERLMGIVALEFAKVSRDAGIPGILAMFEKVLQRDA